MSNQNDLDDQLYILLASMKEYREAIADDNKRLETFYNKVASGVLEQSKKTQITQIRKLHAPFKVVFRS